MRKILSLLLVLSCLAISVFSMGISVSAEEGAYVGSCGADASDTLTWAFDAENGRLVIAGSGFMQDYSPEAGMEAPWYGYRDQIRSVSLSADLSYIGAYAFYNCAELTAVTIPEYVIKIGTSAFGGCVKLTEVFFEDPYDWCVMESADSEMICLSEEDLSNTATAATYLTDTYSGYIWSYNLNMAEGWGTDASDWWWLIPLLILFLILAIAINCFPLIVIVLIVVWIVRHFRKKKLKKEAAKRKKLAVIGGVGLFALGAITATLVKKEKKKKK